MTTRQRVVFAFLILVFFVFGKPGVAAPARISGAPLVYLRSGPGPTHRPLGVLSEGDQVETLEVVGNWSKVETPGGETGFVYSSFLIPAEAAAEDPVASGSTMEASEPLATSTAAPFPEELGPPGAASELTAELAELRTEIAMLRNQLLGDISRSTPAASAASRKPEAGSDGVTPSTDPNVTTLAASMVSLVIGWLLGMIFARRRNRTQRGRLRF